MTTVNDEILRVTGGPTVNDGLMAWYLLNGATGGSQNDRERQFLATKVTIAGKTNQDMWEEYLTSLLLTGTLNDKLLQFWSGL